MQNNKNVSVIIVAGGKGIRMGVRVPKQYLRIKGKMLIEYALEVFLSMEDVSEVVIVCAEEYRALFSHFGNEKRISFASPGKRRQDSVYNGLNEIHNKDALVAIHDAARPCINKAMLEMVFAAAREHGAALLAVPVKCTLKQGDGKGFVKETLSREQIWEAQTPQVARYFLLEKGFEYLIEEEVTVTDDAAVVEAIGRHVKLVEGEYSNIKVTTPEDLDVVEAILDRGYEKREITV